MNNKKNNLKFAFSNLAALITVLGILGAATSSFAALTSITFDASSGNLSASATFVNLGQGQLEVILANTYGGDTLDQAHVLTALYFSGEGKLTPVSAVAGAGSELWENMKSSTPPGSSDLGKQWQYLPGKGISSSGLGIFGPSGNFAPKGEKLGGSSYGLVSEGYDGVQKKKGKGNGGLVDREYLQGSMVFILNGFTGDLNSITGVRFQYGTSTTEPSLKGFAAVPEPATLISGALLLLPMGLGAMRSLRKK